MGKRRNEPLPIAEKVSLIVLCIQLAIVVIVFGAFCLVGYRQPWDINPDYNAPRLTSWLLMLMAVLLGIALLSVAWSVVHAWRHLPLSGRDIDGKAPFRGAILAGTLTTVAMVVTVFCSSSQALIVNGQCYTNGLWLRMADMFVSTSAVLLMAAFAAIIWQKIRG